MLEKEANVGNVVRALGVNPARAFAGVTLVSSGLLINKAYDKIKNDATRRTIITDLHINDPILSGVPEEQLLEWYATIYHFAPKFSLDKQAVKEVLQNFARFGRVDVNTLKMLAETEKAMQDAASKGTSWGSLFTGLADNMMFQSSDAGNPFK